MTLSIPSYSDEPNVSSRRGVALRFLKTLLVEKFMFGPCSGEVRPCALHHDGDAAEDPAGCFSVSGYYRSCHTVIDCTQVGSLKQDG